jgi:ornithine carbamoyltransferase
VHLHVASPEGYRLPNPVVQQSTHASRHGARLRLFNDAADAVAGVDAVYTDTWTSMGKEAEADVRRRVFAPYQVNEELLSVAKPDALFMHCLPAHRGEEVTNEVFESAASIVFDQAENRLHTIKAILVATLG